MGIFNLDVRNFLRVISPYVFIVRKKIDCRDPDKAALLCVYLSGCVCVKIDLTKLDDLKENHNWGCIYWFIMDLV